MHANKFLGISMVGTLNCAACHALIKPKQEFYRWFLEDKSIKLPNPTKQLKGSVVCSRCYLNGETLEERILSPDNKTKQKFNRMDGCVCCICGGFFSFVEPNQDTGTYICPTHR